MKPALALSVFALLFSSVALAAGISFVHATSQYQASEDRGRYNPLNLLDDDPDTVWCEGAPGDGENEGVEIVFKRRQRIDRIAVNPTPKSGRIVTQLRISDGTRVVTVNVGTDPAAALFNRALEGTKFTITIAQVGAPSPQAAVPSDVACLGDTLLYLRDSPFGGGAGKLRYDAKIDRLVGAWNGGALGAPEQVLIFSLDGTWDWTYRPLLGGRSKHLSGDYRFRGDHLLMRTGEVGRWADMQYRWRRVKVDTEAMGAPRGDYDQITLGKGLGAEIAGDYNNARFE